MFANRYFVFQTFISATYKHYDRLKYFYYFSKTASIRGLIRLKIDLKEMISPQNGLCYLKKKITFAVIKNEHC